MSARHRLRRSSRAIALSACLAVLAGVAAPAVLAAWSATARGGAAAHATAMPSGPRPTATLDGDRVTLTWEPAQLGGVALAGYRVSRHDAATGAVVAEAGACGDVVRATTCSTQVPTGRWQWSLVPVQESWTGAAGPHSEVVVVADSGLTVEPSSSAVGAVVRLSGAGFAAGEQVEGVVGDDVVGRSTAQGDGAAAVEGVVPVLAGGAHPAVLRGLASGHAVSGELVVVPAFSVAPASARGGTRLTVVGTGLQPGAAAALSYDGVETATGTADADGRTSLSPLVPFLPAGTRPVVLASGGVTLTTSHTIVPGAAVSPSTTRPGGTVQVVADGLPAGSVDVLLDGARLTTTAADASGRVPPTAVSVPADVVPGEHVVVLRAPDGTSAEARLQVSAGRISTSATEAVVDERIPVTVADWPPGSTVSVRLGSSTSSCSVRVGSDGTASETCRVPALPRGAHALTATVGGATAVGPEVRVRSSAAPASVRASAGAKVTLQALGLAAGAAVTAAFDDGQPAPVGTTNEHGSLGLTLTVPADAAPGRHVVRIADAEGGVDVPVDVLEPTVAFSPTSGRAGTDAFTVQVSGFPPSVAVTVYVGTAAACSALTAADGSGTGSCTVPNRPAGEHAVRATAGAVSATALEALTVLPHVHLSEADSSPGSPLAVHPRGFPYSTTTVRIGGQLVLTFSNNGGARSVTVPDLPAGPTEVVVEGSGVTASAEVTVRRPTLHVPSTTGPVGTAVPVTGAGWIPGSTVNVRVRTASLCNLVSAADGTVAGSCAVPALPAGAYEVNAGQNSYRVHATAAEQVTVVPHLTLSAATVAPGGTVTARLSGFTGGTAYTISLEDGTRLGAGSTASSTGAAGLTVTVPTGTAAGERVVTARDGSGRSASAPLTVTAPAGLVAAADLGTPEPTGEEPAPARLEEGVATQTARRLGQGRRRAG